MQEEYSFEHLEGEQGYPFRAEISQLILQITLTIWHVTVHSTVASSRDVSIACPGGMSFCRSWGMSIVRSAGMLVAPAALLPAKTKEVPSTKRDASACLNNFIGIIS